MGLILLAWTVAGGPALAAPRAPSGKEATAWSALVVQAESARAAGDWRRLERASRKRLEIEQRTYGPDAAVTAVSYSWIGQALARQGRDAQAEPYFRRALEADRKALGDRDRQTLLAMVNLAGVLERLRRFDEAEELRRTLQGLSQAVFGPKSAEAAAAAVALADVLRALARPRDAEPLYRAAVETDLRLFGEADPRHAADLGALASSLDDLGRHEEAEPLHRRALTLRRQAFGERDAATAQAYARMALNLDAQGRHAEAEPLHRLALATDRELRGPRHPATAADLAALGTNLDAQQRHRDAAPLLRSALAIRRASLGDRAAETGSSYADLAANLARLGRTADAERLQRRALTILRESLGERDPATAAAYAALGANLAARHRPRDAQPLLAKALAIRRDVLGEHHPMTAASYDLMAETQRQMADVGQAEALSARAVAIGRAHRAEARSAPGGGADAALRRARAGADETDAAQAPVLRRYLRLAWLAAADRPADLPRLRDAAFVAAQDLETSPAARALAQTAGRAALGRTAGPADARVQQDLSQQVRQLEAQLVRALPDNDPQDAARIGVALDAVGRELAALEARLQNDNPHYADIVAPRSLTLAQAQRRLSPGGGLLLILPAGDDVQIFAVSRTRIAWNRIASGQADLERRFKALRCGVDDESCGAPTALGVRDNHLPSFDSQGAYALYRDLVAPVESALAGVDRLFVTASGPFGALPFSLLLTAPPGPGATGPSGLADAPWLGERYALTTLPSVASLRATRSPATASRRRSFVGYGAPLAAADSRRASFAPLPGAAAELRGMARTLGAGPASVRLGAQATEAAIKSAPDLSRAAVIAFATHGLLSRERLGQDEPGLVLTPPARDSVTDDGVLTASEAAGLSISADWVILSACNTAGSDGAPGADSLSGLARAFLYAGARALLVTHWRVFDESTAAITVQTLSIRNTRPGLSKAQALQRAMRVVRTGRRLDGTALPGWNPEWAHPAHWAPFVLISAGG